MKRIFLLAICALFACNADARTLYVNASRPNNNGNGLSAKKAKKTLQAAINIAKKGDTILVYSGKYTPIKTKNKKITIKSVKGRDQTYIQAAVNNAVLADMGTWKKKQKGYDRSNKKYSDHAQKFSGGTSSTIIGFTLRPKPFMYEWSSYWKYDYYYVAAVAGGTVKNCSVDHCGNAWLYNNGNLAYARTTSSSKSYITVSWPTIYKSKLIECLVTASKGGTSDSIQKNYTYVLTPESGLGICASTLTRCKIIGNMDGWANDNLRNPFLVHDTKFYNCLIAENERMKADNCVFANCTIAKNSNFAMTKSKVQSCIVRGCGKTLFKTAKKNKFTNTFKDDRDPKFIDYVGGEFHLAANSPCINKGKKVSGMGSVDLDGEKRARGAVDMGCYEYFAAQEVTVRFMEYTDNSSDPWILFTEKTYSQPKTYGSLPTPTRMNHVFAGWWTDPIAGKQVFASSAVTAYRLYPHWVRLASLFETRTSCECFATSTSAYEKPNGDSFPQTTGTFALIVPSKLNNLSVTAVSIYTDVSPQLTSITIPKSVASISLWNCSNLKTLRLQNGSPLVPGEDFTVPDGCKVVRY